MLQVSRIIEFAHKVSSNLLICKARLTSSQSRPWKYIYTNYAGHVCTFQSGKNFKCSAAVDIISRELAEA
jgi:hypothetical protein